jgi:hypothetical protein
MLCFNRLLLFFIALGIIGLPNLAAGAMVSPGTVNVRQVGVTSAYLTYRSLAGKVPLEGTWCREVMLGDMCVPGTILGRLPARSDISTLGGNSLFDTATVIMTIPASVVRRAYQSSQAGGSSIFFFSQHFAFPGGGGDEYVIVRCRMGGGGARSPLSLTNVVIQFDTDKEVLSVARNQVPPIYKAIINYNGSGRLKGRWEVVLPGDPQPDRRDLLTEPSVPLDKRGRQRRYTILSRFDIFLPPTGKVVIPGADPRKLPNSYDGRHLILLRVEATDDQESRSLLVDDVDYLSFVKTGGVAGFPMPVLRYYVGKTSHVIPDSMEASKEGDIRLLLPKPNLTYGLTDIIKFYWKKFNNTLIYKLEVANSEGLIFAAAVDPKDHSYSAPSWLKKNQGALRWRVLAYGGKGAPIAQSNWQEFQITAKK